MKNRSAFILAFLFSAVLWAHFDEFKVEKCSLSLADTFEPETKEILQALLPDTRHVFIRVTSIFGVKSFNFRPQGLGHICGGDSKISNEDYQNTECQVVLTTDSAEQSGQYLCHIEEEFLKAGNLYKYDINGKNGVSSQEVSNWIIEATENIPLLLY